MGRGEVSTLGWTRLGERAAVIGNAVFDRTSFRDSLFADVLLPYGSNPFMVADTIGDPMRRSAVRIEGALGLEFGRLGAGFAVGWEGQSNRTSASPVPRLDRTASPGFSIGASYDLGTIRLGAFGRYRQIAEFIQIYTVAQPSRIFQIEGYEEPIPLDLQPDRYRRRFERDSHAWGASAAFDALAGTWTLYGRREQTSEAQFTRTAEADPPSDTWDADGWHVGFAGQWGFGPGDEPAWLVTVDSRYRTLSGEAYQAAIDGILFTVDETRLEAGVDLRGEIGDGWLLGGRLEVRRSDRRDRLASAASDITATELGGSAEIGRAFGRFGVSVGGLYSAYRPTGTIPDPATLGPEYRRFMGPGLALELTDATTAAGNVTVRWQAWSSAGLWLRGVYGSLSPSDASIPLAPDGTRPAWIITAGAVLDEVWP